MLSRTHTASQFVAVHHWHIAIGDYHIKRLALKTRKSLLTIFRLDHRMPEEL
ncbi:hypothetical protein D3C81_2066180 [compost metagenome]